MKRGIEIEEKKMLRKKKKWERKGRKCKGKVNKKRKWEVKGLSVKSTGDFVEGSRAGATGLQCRLA